MFYQIAYEGDFWSLCTVTFWQKIHLLIGNATTWYVQQNFYTKYLNISNTHISLTRHHWLISFLKLKKDGNKRFTDWNIWNTYVLHMLAIWDQSHGCEFLAAPINSQRVVPKSDTYNTDCYNTTTSFWKQPFHDLSHLYWDPWLWNSIIAAQ